MGLCPRARVELRYYKQNNLVYENMTKQNKTEKNDSNAYKIKAPPYPCQNQWYMYMYYAQYVNIAPEVV